MHKCLTTTFLDNDLLKYWNPEITRGNYLIKASNSHLNNCPASWFPFAGLIAETRLCKWHDGIIIAFPLPCTPQPSQEKNPCRELINNNLVPQWQPDVSSVLLWIRAFIGFKEIHFILHLRAKAPSKEGRKTGRQWQWRECIYDRLSHISTLPLPELSSFSPFLWKSFESLNFSLSSNNIQMTLLPPPSFQ